MTKSPEKNRLIKIALYKNSKSFFGGVIRYQQKHWDKLPEKFSGYSHAELVFCDLQKGERHKICKTGFLYKNNKNIKDYPWVALYNLNTLLSEQDYYKNVYRANK